VSEVRIITVNTIIIVMHSFVSSVVGNLSRRQCSSRVSGSKSKLTLLAQRRPLSTSKCVRLSGATRDSSSVVVPSRNLLSYGQPTLGKS
jgi:hypothetical protein